MSTKRKKGVNYCDTCRAESPYMVMLREKLWLSIAKKEEFLCPDCIETRLDRKITPADFKRAAGQTLKNIPIPVNIWFAESRKDCPRMRRFLRRVKKLDEAAEESLKTKRKKAEPAPPPWYDRNKLCRIRFAPDETGWAVNMGNGTYRLANNPIAAMCTGPDYKDAARWGDLVRQGKNLTDKDGEIYSCLEVIERYKPETDETKTC